MRFGVILPIQLEGHGRSTCTGRSCARRSRSPRRPGFDAVFLPEFHQARGGALVSPLLRRRGAAAGDDADPLRLGRARDAAPPPGATRRGRDHARLDHPRARRARAGDRAPGARLQGVRRAARRARSRCSRRCRRARARASRASRTSTRASSSERRPTSPRSPTQPAAGVLDRRALAPGLERAARRADLWIVDPQRDVHDVARLAGTTARARRRTARSRASRLFREAWIGESARSASASGANALQVHRLYYNVGIYTSASSPGSTRSRPGRLHARPARPRAVPLRAPGRGAGEVEEWREITGATTWRSASAIPAARATRRRSRRCACSAPR